MQDVGADATVRGRGGRSEDKEAMFNGKRLILKW